MAIAAVDAVYFQGMRASIHIRKMMPASKMAVERFPKRIGNMVAAVMPSVKKK